MYKLKTAIISLLAISLFAVPANAFAATLTLTPSSGTINKGCTFQVGVDVDTEGKNTDGTDIILKYNTSQLTPTAITEGTLYPGSLIVKDFTTTPGTIKISALAASTAPVKGSGRVANISFTTSSQTSGSAALTFDFDAANKTKTTDSNVVESVTTVEILDGVTDGSYSIGSGSCVTANGGIITSTTNTSKGGTGDGTLPEAGVSTPTLILAAVGGILTILGIIGLAIL